MLWPIVKHCYIFFYLNCIVLTFKTDEVDKQFTSFIKITPVIDKT